MPGVPSLVSAIASVHAGALSEGLEQLLALHATHGPASTEPLPDIELATLLGALIDCRLARGDLANAMTLGEQLTPLLTGTGLAAALAHQARGEVSAALGDAETAVAHFVTAGQLAPDADSDTLPWRAGAALAHLRNGNARAAGALAREHVELASKSDSPYSMPGALRTLAAVDAGPDRIQHLLRARAVLAATQAERLGRRRRTRAGGPA